MEPFEDSVYDVVGVSWKQSPEYAKKACPTKVLQGNLDPVVLYAPVKEIEWRVKDILERAGQRPGHIFNLGHGILP